MWRVKPITNSKRLQIFQARTQTFGWGGGQDFEKVDQNFKFPQIVKKGGKRENLHKWELYDKNVPVRVRFKKKSRFLGRIFAKFDQILASFL